jgi:hypothetical protein
MVEVLLNVISLCKFQPPLVIASTTRRNLIAIQQMPSGASIRHCGFFVTFCYSCVKRWSLNNDCLIAPIFLCNKYMYMKLMHAPFDDTLLDLRGTCFGYRKLTLPKCYSAFRKGCHAPFLKKKKKKVQQIKNFRVNLAISMQHGVCQTWAAGFSREGVLDL